MRRKPTTPTERSKDSLLQERRASLQGRRDANPLLRLKGALSRPVTLQWRDGQPRVVLLERRSATRLTRAQAHLCDELRARLLAQGADEASKLLRHLAIVHDKFWRKGWDGVVALPASVLAKAVMQADMLDREEPSPALQEFVETLRLQHGAALAREQARGRRAQDDASAPNTLEVKEASYQEFEELERSWSHTMPSDLAPLSAEG